MKQLRILVHDYAGHPFQVQLSRELARRGHTVCHAYSRSVQTPQGTLALQPEDPSTLSITGISIGETIAKENLWRRRSQELAYGQKLCELIEKFRPDVLISGNTPLEAQALVLRTSKRVGSRFVFWLQDIYSVAVHRLLRRRLPIVGTAVGKYYSVLERRLLRESNCIVLISEDFKSVLSDWGLPERRIFVIENWAPIDEVPVHDKDNAWAQSHGLAERFCFLYTGTLGMKHNPEILARLALHFRDDPDVRVVVRSEGAGAEWLKRERLRLSIENLYIDGFVDFREYPLVLASADVLVAILEPDAGIFSVPSKVLSYLCAKRPLLLGVPLENLAARIVHRHHAGEVVPPWNLDEFLKAAERLRSDADLRRRYGENARRYAEDHFNIGVIADRFEAVIAASLSS